RKWESSSYRTTQFARLQTRKTCCSTFSRLPTSRPQTPAIGIEHSWNAHSASAAERANSADRLSWKALPEPLCEPELPLLMSSAAKGTAFEDRVFPTPDQQLRDGHRQVLAEITPDFSRRKAITQRTVLHLPTAYKQLSVTDYLLASMPVDFR